MRRFFKNFGQEMIISKKRIFFFVVFIFLTVALFAAPLGTDYPKVPRATPAQARQLVVEAAKKYLGVPYVYAGLSSRGLDCSGFIRVSFNDALGIPFASMPASALGQYQWAERVNINNAQPGDLVFFRTGATSQVTHVGLYIGDRQFLHAASAGSKTGIIYSNLDENYYKERFVSAGRVLPSSSGSILSGNRQRNTETTSEPNRPRNTEAKDSSSSNSLFISTAFAPSWNLFYINQEVLRGYSSHIGFGIDISPRLVFGIELRPEYDTLLGVFRIPLTLSWGPSEKLRFFAGPVYSFADDGSFFFRDETRYYSSDTNWFGTAGLSYTPFVFKGKRNDFAPYLEGAWQSYMSENNRFRLFPDFMACVRVSTGLRWRFYF